MVAANETTEAPSNAAAANPPAATAPSRPPGRQGSVVRAVNRLQRAASSEEDDYGPWGWFFAFLVAGLLVLGILGFIAAYVPMWIMEITSTYEAVQWLWDNDESKPSAVDIFFQLLFFSYVAGDICAGYRLDGALDWNWTYLLLFQAFGTLSFPLSFPVQAILAVIQFILVGLQLDGFIYTYWAVVLIPTWLACLFTIALLASTAFPESFWKGLGAIALSLCVILPFPLAIYRIEGSNAFSTVYIILPWLILGLVFGWPSRWASPVPNPPSAGQPAALPTM
ncbi:hypothetical protein AC1031_016874 [Aphanomyces cochlioides]|nr:hypothetical protein AC1031_016874 [Aphanomyces cochlioides]